MTIPITGQPPVPGLDDPATFNTKALNLLAWITGSMLDQFNAVDPNDFFALATQLQAEAGTDNTKIMTALRTAEAIAALAASTAQGVQPGTLIPYGGLTPPPETIKCNFAAVSRTTYADLFTAIGTSFGAGNGSTTFNVPEGRAVVLRGLDDGRGVDTGRVIGTEQADRVGAHQETAYTVFNAGTSTGAGFVYSSTGQNLGTRNLDAYGTGETRVRNLAVLWCIKY
jgi:microcystin-dependent protein